MVARRSITKPSSRLEWTSTLGTSWRSIFASAEVVDWIGGRPLHAGWGETITSSYYLPHHPVPLDSTASDV